jgi:hypothetical protein
MEQATASSREALEPLAHCPLAHVLDAEKLLLKSFYI